MRNGEAGEYFLMTSSAIGEEAFAGFLNLGRHRMLNVESIAPATWHLDKFLHVSARIVGWVTGRVRNNGYENYVL